MNEAAPHSRRSVTLLLSEELVRDVERLGGNLSQTVEDLLQDFVAKQRSEDAAKQARIEAAIDMHNAHYKEFGLVGEDFIPL